MALKPCTECRKEISTLAATCPNCGAPVVKEPQKSAGLSVGRGVLIGVLAFGAIVAISIMIDTGERQRRDAQASQPTPEAPELGARRVKLLEDLQRQGVFGRIECRGAGGDAWVAPAFYALTFDDKQIFTSVAYAYCFGAANRDSHITLRDDRTGKDVGTYWGRRGLDLE